MRAGWWAVVLMGCQGCPPGDPPDDPGPFVPEVDEATVDQYSFDAERFVLALGGTDPVTCPDQTSRGWDAERVFSELFPGDPYTTPFGDPLSRLCLYVSRGGSASRTAFEGQRDPGGESVEVTADAAGTALPAGTEGVNDHVVVRLEAVDSQKLAALQHFQFVERAGMALRDPVPDSLDLRQAEITRLAILDTVPDSPFPDATDIWAQPDSHGLWIAALARELTCAEGVFCPVQLTTRQVMQQARTSFGAAEGGAAWGTLSGLARALQSEVRQWQSDRDAQAVGNLVINLSLAWHPRFGGGMPGAWTFEGDGMPVQTKAGETTFSWALVEPSQFPADARAVYQALALARCAGAVVVAAAGNETGGPKGRSGPLLPAAWEGLDPQRTANCATLGLARTDPGPAHALVWAAGGVDADGSDLSVSREDGRPHLLAYADQATHDLGTNPVGRLGPALTGTSVASIVIASTAAVRWGWEASSTGASVMDRLYASGKAKDSVSGWISHRTADLYPDVSGNEARLIRPCDALGDLDRGYVCKAIDDPGTDFAQSTLTDQAENTWPGNPETFEACGDRLVYRVAAEGGEASSDPCPSLQYYSPAVSPWIHPQPVTEGCEDCFLDLDLGRLYIDLPNLWTVSALSVVMKAGTQVYEFNIPTAMVTTGSTELTLKFNPATAPTSIDNAKLTAAREGRSLSWPLMLVDAP